MDPGFLAKLEQARLKANFPWVITAGYRTVSHNKKLGGAPNSWHLKGMAADIACTNGWQRYIIVKSAIEAGIFGIEVCEKHIHLDNRPDPCMWCDVDK